MEGSEFVFDDVNLFYYTRNEMNCGGSCLDSPIWLKNRIAAINPKNSDDKCFQYGKIVPLTHFSPVSHFYTPWKRQKTKGFLKFSGGIEIWHWTKMS